MKDRTIFVTRQDMQRLSDLVEFAERISSKDLEYLRRLKEELRRSEIVSSDEIPPDVVTMNSRVRVRDLDSGRESVYNLVFPRDADIAQGRISILAPIGTAMIGYRAGDIVTWPGPSGIKRFKLEQILCQPETAGQAA